MIGFTVDQAKGFFFDKESVTKALEKAEVKRLSKIGADIRRLAQKSIQIRPGPALPGRPPHGHITGVRVRKSKSKGTIRNQPVSLLREFIYFVYEPRNHNVVIGPAKLNMRGNAPEALEKGGQSQVMIGPPDNRRLETVNIRKRPYMVPALQEVSAQLDPMWKDCIRA